LGFELIEDVVAGKLKPMPYLKSNSLSFSVNDPVTVKEVGVVPEFSGPLTETSGEHVSILSSPSAFPSEVAEKMI
jgi:hypothetical protein